MFQILHGINIDWMRRRRIAYMVSGLLMAISIASLVMRGGPRYGIDFTGGTLIEAVLTPAPSPDLVRGAIEKAGFPTGEIQQRLDQKEHFLIRLGEAEGG
ncbi:MAG TPA: protein translocase subunit SecF, partial [Candidatus Eisenbacteria bacterium]|nr:protein translocase subunit SecF [Candidatus Eisenbacteria bacterium]